jgi:hypothetical protein
MDRNKKTFIITLTAIWLLTIAAIAALNAAKP